ncbi:response regulator [Luteibacter sp. UNCMF331Sha3.1]|uniref:response regulator n=1 Tax=Luteibacter sp. UNCMF331Sha3.1 TaxID=1502760 RepID=UPI00147EF467|nr:response regulator [Luteibacter sp. UNCMF331Sha3.1]
MDDDDGVRESIASFFASVGMSVATFRAAEDLLSSERLPIADFVVSDLHMPGMSGVGLLQEVRARRPDLPVVIMTAFGTAEARAQATQLGVHAFLCKPVDPENLLVLIRTALVGDTANQ